MEWIKVDPSDAERAAEAAARVLAAGGLIVFPAERLYGLGADAMNEDAVVRVFELKGRPAAMPLPVIVGSMADALELCETDATARALMERFWPGPLTLVLPLKARLPERVTAGTGAVGVRAPGNELAGMIAAKLGRPVIATSANASGGESSRTAEEAVAGLRGEVDLVVDQGALAGPPGSTVVRVSGGMEIIRAGVIGLDEITACIKGASSA